MSKAPIDGIEIYYELAGKGDPLVLISGTGLHSKIWKPYQVPFFSKEFAVLISDHRGVGFSDKPDGFYSTRAFARDVVALMEHLAFGPAHILGHSMGGRVAQWIALDNPEAVRTLILADSGSGNFSGDPDYIRGVPLDVAEELAQDGYDKYLRNHMEGEFIFSKGFAQREPERFREMVDLKLNNPPPLRCYLRHVIARQMHETTDRLSEIRAPTLVMVGDHDNVRVNTGNHFEGAKVLVERIPGARMAVIRNSAHGIFWEQPEESNRVVYEFMRAH